MLTQQDIDKFRAQFKCKQDILDYALEINQKIADCYDNGMINSYAESEALKLHMYLFGNVSANTFREYVDYVHKKLDRPNLLCGMPGVSYSEVEG